MFCIFACIYLKTYGFNLQSGGLRILPPVLTAFESGIVPRQPSNADASVTALFGVKEHLFQA